MRYLDRIQLRNMFYFFAGVFNKAESIFATGMDVHRTSFNTRNVFIHVLNFFQ